MTTTPDRQILRDWRDTHDDVQPDHDGQACDRWILTGSAVGQCGRMSSWIARGRALCEAHTVEQIQQWASYERGEVPA